MNWTITTMAVAGGEYIAMLRSPERVLIASVRRGGPNAKDDAIRAAVAKAPPGVFIEGAA